MNVGLCLARLPADATMPCQAWQPGNSKHALPKRLRHGCNAEPPYYVRRYASKHAIHFQRTDKMRYRVNVEACLARLDGPADATMTCQAW